MAKFRYPDQSNIYVQGAHSLLKVTRKIDGIENLIFYIVPAVQEDLFLKDPHLFDTSLDARVITKLPTALYHTNQTKYDQHINEMFESLTSIMGVVTDHN